MKRWLVLVLFVAFPVAVFADSVQTVDGQVLEGERISGLPSEIVLIDGEVTISIDAARLATLSLSGGIVTLTTTADREVSGSLASDITSVSLKTETGEVQVPFAQVAGLTLERKPTTEAEYSALITLADGRVFAGDLARSFPTEIGIDSNGIVTTTRLSAITVLTFGDPVTVETASGTQSGHLVTTMPESIVMATDFGSYSIPTNQAVELRVSEPRSYASPDLPSPLSNSAGVGLKVWGGFPAVLGNVTLGSLAMELGVGYRSAPLLYGLIDVSMLFYFANARYLISLPYIGGVLRPYFGGGIVGVTAIASAGGLSGSASVLAVDAFVGIELSLAALGIPVTLFVATDWAPLFSDATFFRQFGARVDFGF